MKHGHRFGWGAIVALLGLGLLAGCHQAGGPSSALTTAAVLPVSESTPKLSNAQVADVQVAYGRALEKRGAADAAAGVYQEALRHDANRSDAMARLAVLHDRQAKFEESVELHRKALAGQPENPDLYCNLGYSLYLQGNWAEAEANLRRAVALAPDHRRAHTNLGLVLSRLGRTDEALAEFRRAGCDETEAHSNLAFVLTLEQRLPEARRHYQQALTADPSSAAVRQRLRDLDTLAARLEAPVKSQAVAQDSNHPPAQAPHGN